jgi:hypothetical protein
MHGQMGEKESQVLPILMVDFAKLEYFGTFIFKKKMINLIINILIIKDICEIIGDNLIIV